MPYTKEQLKNNENYERAIEAARREQINTFVKAVSYTHLTLPTKA